MPVGGGVRGHRRRRDIVPKPCMPLHAKEWPCMYVRTYIHNIRMYACMYVWEGVDMRGADMKRGKYEKG